MNTDTICQWLGLPGGVWPPDDRTLLGLAPGPVEPHVVEERALAQMEKLRPHQLMQPELVTEGMNRLAQALITLTDEAARQKPPTPATEADDLILDLDRVNRPTPSNAEVVAQPRVLDAEIVPIRKPRKPARPKRKERPKRRPQRPTEPAVEIPVIEPLPPGTGYDPRERRKGYAELAELRKVIAAWERLQPSFGVPSEDLSRPASVFDFVDSVADCRQAVAVYGRTDWFRTHGRNVLTVVQHPLSLNLFRQLVTSQRRSVATDWAYALAELRALAVGLRQELNDTKPRRPLAKAVAGVRAVARANPEWLLGLVVCATLAVGFWRSAR